MTPQRFLLLTLLSMSAFFTFWALRSTSPLAGLLVFAAPPAILSLGAFLHWPRIGFISAVLALLWFSHGVMLAWAEPSQRGFALLEAVLALLVIYAACLPGIHARRAKLQAK